MYVLHVNSCVLSCDLLLKYLIYFKKSTIKKKRTIKVSNSHLNINIILIYLHIILDKTVCCKSIILSSCKSMQCMGQLQIFVSI